MRLKHDHNTLVLMVPYQREESRSSVGVRHAVLVECHSACRILLYKSAAVVNFQSKSLERVLEHLTEILGLRQASSLAWTCSMYFEATSIALLCIT